MRREKELQVMPQCFAQLSDLHLSTLNGVRRRDLVSKRGLGYLSWRRKRRFEHRTEVLDALKRDLALAELDQLLVTGDLTHIGLPQEFEQARVWLEKLGKPHQIALVPGNHDACVAAPWSETFALWRDYMASDSDCNSALETIHFPSLRIRGSIAFIGLSSACPKPPLMATGTIDNEQIQRLPALLEYAADAGLFRVVYLHHCPMAGKEKWRKRLTNASEVQGMLEEHGAELVLHGHGHRAHYNELQTRHGNMPIIAVPSASALGLHGADIAHYNHYELERNQQGWQLSIDSRRYQPAIDAFCKGTNRTLQINRRP